MITCKFPRCVSEPRKRDYCIRHYEKLRRTKYLRVTYRVIDSAPIRARIDEHMERGRRLTTLAKAAGVHAGSLWLVYEQHTPIRTTTARRVMAVPLPPTLIGIRRRLQALERIGYSARAFSRVTGISITALSYGLRVGPLTVDTRLRVVAAYEELSVKPLDAPLVIAKAIKLQYYAPADWEYVDIDDPDASPCEPDVDETVDETEVELLISGYYSNPTRLRPSRAALLKAVVHLTELNWGAKRISEWVRITPRTVERMRAEARGEKLPYQKELRTHCTKENHPLTTENTRIDKKGRRNCRICERRYKSRKRQEAKLAA